MNCAIRVATAIFLLLASAEVRADPAADCNDGSNLTRQIRGCTQVIQKTMRSDAVSTAYMNRAIAYAQRQQYTKSLADFTSAIHADKDNNFAYYNRGNIYLELRKPRQAIADYSKAIEIASDMSPALLNRALAHEVLGERDKSIADFRAAAELEPTLTAAYEGLKRLGATPRPEEGDAAH